MAKNSSKKVDIQGSEGNKILYGLLLLAVLILGSFAYIFYSISNLNNKIDSINNSLELESEDHFINVQHNMAESIVAVLSSPAHNDNGTNNIIFLDNAGQEWNLGTGFSFDDNGNILTAYHVIKNTSKLLILTKDGKTIPVFNSKDIPDLDLSILFVNSTLPSVKLQNGLSYIGASIAFTGYPLSTRINGQNIPVESTVKGSVSNLIPFTYNNQLVPVYVLGAAANKGNSGGPVFSLKTGEVIGIINEKIIGTEGITISTAINQELINKLLNGK